MRRLMLLLSLSCACGGGLVPVKRNLALQPGGSGYSVSLVYPGLHAHHAAELLQANADAHAERFSCPGGPQASLTSASEETTPPPKDAPEGAEPKSTTKVEGTVVCQAPSSP